MEHLPDPLPVLEEVAARLRERSGVFVVEVPSADGLVADKAGQSGETPELRRAYEQSTSQLGLTDTPIAVA